MSEKKEWENVQEDSMGNKLRQICVHAVSRCEGYKQTTTKSCMCLGIKKEEEENNNNKEKRNQNEGDDFASRLLFMGNIIY